MAQKAKPTTTDESPWVLLSREQLDGPEYTVTHAMRIPGLGVLVRVTTGVDAGRVDSPAKGYASVALQMIVGADLSHENGDVCIMATNLAQGRAAIR